jgi:leucyl aminopeptidase (aminopeptidase T)
LSPSHFFLKQKHFIGSLHIDNMISQSHMQRIARNIIRNSMFVKQKEAVHISTGSEAVEFAEMMAFEAAMLGANPSINYASDKLTTKIYKNIKTKYLKNIPKLSKILAKKVDVQIYIDDSNPFLEKNNRQKGC